MSKKPSFQKKVITKLRCYIKKPLNSNFSYKHLPSVFLWSKYSGKNINTKDFWDEIHSREDKNPGNRFDQLVLSFLGRLDFENKDILDIGCGRGHFLGQINNAKSLTGVDISEEAIKIVNNRSIEGHVRTLPDINLDRKFDVITSFETIEHTRKWKQSIKEMTRLLRDDGLLILSVPFEDSIVMEEHVAYFDVERLYKTLKSKLTVLEIKIIGPWLMIIAQNKKYKRGEIPSYYLNE